MTWNCHEHRNELRSTSSGCIYHEDHGVLCYGEEVGWNLWLYHPVIFKDRAAANRWIVSGCIAEIQESFHNLQVGFRTRFLAAKNGYTLGEDLE